LELNKEVPPSNYNPPMKFEYCGPNGTYVYAPENVFSVKVIVTFIFELVKKKNQLGSST
jgi:hypothetical protein